jgi:CBS domain containing-hemolysin-like protein
VLIELSILGALVIGTYLSALSLALIQLSRSALQHRLDASGRGRDATWLVEHRDRVTLLTSLLRSCFRLGIFVLVLVEIIGVGESAKLEPVPLTIAFLIAVLLVWIFTSVVASAIARYAGTGLIIYSMLPLKLFALLSLPIAHGLKLIDEIVRRLSGAATAQDTSAAAEAELLRRIEETQLQGGLDEEAAEMLENVVEFGSADTAEAMTPRTDIEGIELNNDLDAIKAFLIDAGHSRIPVYRESLDNIIGILYAKDLLRYVGEDASDFSLEPILRKPIVVPETKPLRELLGEFQRHEVHMAIVVDEYGGTAGLITIEDVLEELVGEIHDEHDTGDEEEPTLTRLDDAHAEVDGRYHIDDLNEELSLQIPEDPDYDTIAGFVLAQLGRVPEVGESVEAHGARFTTLEGTPTSVKKLAVELLAPASINGNGSDAK